MAAKNIQQSFEELETTYSFFYLKIFMVQLLKDITYTQHEHIEFKFILHFRFSYRTQSTLLIEIT